MGRASRASRPSAPPVAATAAAEGRGGTGLPGLPSVDFSGWNWEWLLGGNWLARIGIVALIIGAGFFISLAIENGWLGETERVALGIVGGLAFLGAGEYWRKRYAVWAQTVTGGGLAILYLSIYGAFALYGLISPLTAFGMFFLITLAGAGLALRPTPSQPNGAVAIAVFSIFGGFATPLLLQERLPDERLLLAYVLVLDLGVLALASLRNWRWFTLLSWAGSLVLFGFWQRELEPAIALSQVGLTVIFLIFAGATTLFHLIWRRAANIADLALMLLNGAAYFGISYWLIFNEFRPWIGGFTVLLGAFYVLMSYLALLGGRTQLNLGLFAAGMGVTFITIAAPVQLGGPWVSLAWGVEGLVLLELSFLLRIRELRWFGYIVFAVSGVWLLALDTPGAFREDFTPFLNDYMLSYGGAVLLPALASYLIWRRRDGLEWHEQDGRHVFAVWACVFAAIAVPLQLDGAWITVAWAVEALFLLWLSFPLKMPPVRWFGYVMFAVFSVWLLAVDTPGAFWEDLALFLNWYMLSYAVVILSFALAGYLLWLRREVVDQREQAAYPVFAVGACVFGAIAVPLQLEGVWVTVAWAAEAIFLLALSFLIRMREVRWFSYGLLGAMLARLLAFDTFDLDLETFRPVVNWRFLSFAVAIATLYLAAGLVRRDSGRLAFRMTQEETQAVFLALLGLANFVTLWILSAEIMASADSAFFNLPADVSENVTSLGLSLLWAIYAAVLIVLGVARRSRWVRVAGLALLAVPVVKLFAFDSRLLEQEYRVIAFLTLGLILVAGGLLYQRYSRVVRGFLFE